MVATASVLAVLAAGGAAASARATTRYVALGDSVTQVGSSETYPARYFGALHDHGLADDLQNVGVSGETSTSILGGQLTRAEEAIDDPATDTTVVTVDIGGNDVLGDPSCSGFSPTFDLAACQPTLQQFAANYAELLDDLDAALAGDPGSEHVIGMTYYNPGSGRPGQEAQAADVDLAELGTDGRIDCAGTGQQLGLNDLIACVGAAHGAEVADVHPAFVGKGDEWFFDQIHPNDTGHAVIALVFAGVYGLGGPGSPPPAPDVTPPVLTLPAAIRVDATSPEGTQVRYSAEATDTVDPAPVVVCLPSSGTRFAIGRTVVGCTATDASGNRGQGSFAVVVRGARSQLHDLLVRVRAASGHLHVTALLAGDLRAARRALEAGRRRRARHRLTVFIADVRAHRGHGLPSGRAVRFITAARRVRFLIRP